MIKTGILITGSWFFRVFNDFSCLVLNLVFPPEGPKTILGPAQRPRVGYRPEYFFPGGSIYDNHIAVDKQAPRNYIRSQNFAREVVLNLVPILVVATPQRSSMTMCHRLPTFVTDFARRSCSRVTTRTRMFKPLVAIDGFGHNFASLWQMRVPFVLAVVMCIRATHIFNHIIHWMFISKVHHINHYAVTPPAPAAGYLRVIPTLALGTDHGQRKWSFSW